MKTIASSLMLIIVLVACDEAPEIKQHLKPMKEMHYDMDLQELIAEKTFEYDRHGQLVKETYTDFRSAGSNRTVYTRNAAGQVTMLINTFDSQPESPNTLRYTYAGGVNTMVERLTPQGDVTNKTVYTYRNGLAESAVHYYNSSGDFVENGVYHYAYDSQGQLVTETVTLDGATYTLHANEYDAAGKLVRSCNPVTGSPDAYNCVRYEFEGELLFEKYGTLTGTEDVLLEQHFYDDGRRTETLMPNQVYSIAPFQAVVFFTRRIVYQY